MIFISNSSSSSFLICLIHLGSFASGKVETINTNGDRRLRHDQRDIKARRRRVQEDGMSLAPIQEDAFDTMPKSDSVQVQESDGVALLTNKKMDLEDLISVGLEGAAIKVDDNVVGHLMDAIEMYHSNWKEFPKYKKCMILESIVLMPIFEGKLDALLEYLGCGKDPVTSTTQATSTTTPGCESNYAAGSVPLYGTCDVDCACSPWKCTQMFCISELLFSISNSLSNIVFASCILKSS